MHVERLLANGGSAAGRRLTTERELAGETIRSLSGSLSPCPRLPRPELPLAGPRETKVDDRPEGARSEQAFRVTPSVQRLGQWRGAADHQRIEKRAK
jgi:hypothetical protein